ncbi:Gfo/Idh/MocA family oxidoreductase [Mammaliicoccus lentus]|uniref:Gfo/Idh/MocA family oxidoreductase n=1 Tax=Mammaliicoccus lentus TaxID=42858 RepID=UPI0031F6D671
MLLPHPGVSARPTSGHFPERFRFAFINELNTFVNSIKNKEKSSVTGVDGLKSTEVAIAMQESFETKNIITL